MPKSLPDNTFILLDGLETSRFGVCLAVNLGARLTK